jgi:hypothetical protein
MGMMAGLGVTTYYAWWINQPWLRAIPWDRFSGFILVGNRPYFPGFGTFYAPATFSVIIPQIDYKTTHSGYPGIC